MNRTLERHEEGKAGQGRVPIGTRNPYAKPRLTKLGTVRDITAATRGTGRIDGTPRGPNRTQRGGNFDGSAGDL